MTDHSDSDDEYRPIQLGSSNTAPRAVQTVLRQRFPMRRYHIGPDGRLTNLAKVMDRSSDTLNVATASAAESAPNTSTGAMDSVIRSITALLQPHTSSPNIPVITRVITNLITSDYNEEDLSQALNPQLDSLGISPQTKQGTIPALLGIANLAKLQLQGTPTSTSRSQHTMPDLEPLSHPETSSIPTVPYQVRQRPFTSSSGSGQTVWYSSKTTSSILVPPRVPQAKTGHIFVHHDTSRDISQYWMFSIGNDWVRVTPGAEYPLNHDRALAIRTNGEPSWVTRASIVTTRTRRDKEIREKSVQG